MEAYDKYIFVLCLIVFTALTTMFGLLIYRMYKMRIKIIKGGLADDEIMKEQQVTAKQKNLAVHFIFHRFIPICITLSLVALFGLSIGVRFSENKTINTPIVKVVKSNSMAYTYEKNTYVEDNNLNHQFQKFDLVIINPLPKEEELQVYDIVVYESNGYFVIHRIVGIEEPNEEHEERYFLLQGDANQYPDKFPVRYSQMRGIYKGQRIRYLGSFIDFMNSPAGYLCILLVLFVYVITPIIDKKLLVSFNERKAVLVFENEMRNVSFVKGKFSKSLLADFVQSQLNEEVVIKRGKDYTRTGLAIPDTYYVVKGKKKKCFAYVYAYKSGKTIIRVIADDNFGKEFNQLQLTKFPKSKKDQWYVLSLDNMNEDNSKLIWKVISTSFFKVHHEESEVIVV